MTRYSGKSDDGIALFLVLWILVLLSVIAGEFCYTMRAETNMTRDFTERARAYYAAYAGIQKGIEEIIRAKMIPPMIPSTDMDETGVSGKKEIQWRVNVKIPPIPFGDEQFEVRLDNESGKVNINSASANMLRILLNTFDLDEHHKDVIVDSTMDWRDTDDLHRLNGAENDYYEQLPKPYKCKNGDFDSVEELCLVRGLTDKIFYGGLKEMVTTIHGPLLKDRSVASNRININAASSRMLASLPMMTDDVVKEIKAYREKQDIVSLGDLIPVVGPGVYQAIAPYLTVNMSPYYTISSSGIAPDGRTRAVLSAVMKIDPTAPKGYLIVKWDDAPEDITKFDAEPASSSSQ